LFTSEQWDIIQELHKVLQEPVADNNDRIVTVAVLKLIISLITEDVSQMSLYETPIMHYLAIRAINTATQTFRSPALYTPILAQILWIIRLLVLELTISDEGWDELGVPSRIEVGKERGAVAARIQEFRQKHLCEGSFSPASSILTQLARGQALNRGTQKSSNIY
jgi:hypothetical protein